MIVLFHNLITDTQSSGTQKDTGSDIRSEEEIC